MTWKNRIIGHDEVDADELQWHPHNPRIHPQRQAEAVSGLLEQVGWVDELIVNLRTGEEWPEDQRNVKTILNGHLRSRLAQDSGQKVPVRYVDLTPWQESLIVATFDPSAEQAETDRRQLAALLGTLDMTPVEDTGLGELLTQLDEYAHAHENAYQPDYEPEVGPQREVTEEDVQKEKERLEGRFEAESAPAQIEILCPHCHGTYYIDKKEIE